MTDPDVRVPVILAAWATLSVLILALKYSGFAAILGLGIGICGVILGKKV